MIMTLSIAKFRMTCIYSVSALFLLLTVCAAASAEVKRYTVPEEGSPVIGPDKADITIIEFIDYQ